MAEEIYITATEAAERLCVKRRRITDYCQDGRIERARKANGAWEVPLSVVEKLEDKHIIDVNRAAEEMQITRQAVAQLCAAGKIEGAFRFGNRWKIPSPIVQIRSKPGRPPASAVKAS